MSSKPGQRHLCVAARCIEISRDTRLEGSLAALLPEGVGRRRSSQDPAISLRALPCGRYTVQGHASTEHVGPAADALGLVMTAVTEALAAGPWDDELLALHAAVICRGEATVVICGTSGAGKSTLTAAALDQGWSLLSEELTLVDEHLFAQPFARPLALKGLAKELFPHVDPRSHGVPAQFVGEEWLVNPRWFGGSVVELPRRVTHLVAPAYGAAEPCGATPLSAGDALMLLAANSSALPLLRAPLQRLRRFAQSVPCWRLVYRDTETSLRLLESVAAPA